MSIKIWAFLQNQSQCGNFISLLTVETEDTLQLNLEPNHIALAHLPGETVLPVFLSSAPTTKFSASPLPYVSSLYLRYVKNRLASSSAQKCYAAIKKLICPHKNFLANDENYRKGCEDSSKA